MRPGGVRTAVTRALLTMLLVVAAWATKEPASSPSLPAGGSADVSQYVGADTCKTCHEDIYKNFEGTRHFKTTLTNKGPQWHGCEACHGPGKAHVDSGGDKSKIFTFENATTEQIDQRCLSCHEFDQQHANFERSRHATNNVSCIACHSPHHAKDAQYLLVEKQPQLCYGCHTEKKAEFNRPFRHRVEQGLIECSDCHNPHGSVLNSQLRETAAQDQVCFKCHADKEGPFVFEHRPIKTEGCVYCHSPHGSTNPRLLKRADVNLLCLDCHTETAGSEVPGMPSFHNQSQKYQACTMCHVQIHGSNFDEFFFK